MGLPSGIVKGETVKRLKMLSALPVIALLIVVGEIGNGSISSGECHVVDADVWETVSSNGLLSISLGGVTECAPDWISCQSHKLVGPVCHICALAYLRLG